ncbi:c-type cytochrome [Sabulilitoribacter arenilitoris]|uniref:C-type cytochrome n=1 Tax=Wocania arenilitoris TaxID=2044858 RepID=A0AAE3EKL3_9FLAO|nr:c-type cytochrome [Wocania arenilitoris]MCF7567020.1 c-type cytochrome [Wocania arenilitoris]
MMSYISKFFVLMVCAVALQNCNSEKSKAIPIEDKPINIKIEENENPAEIDITPFAGPDIVPSPACLAVAANGEVYVGVDMMGSLGKEPNKGSIIKLIDSNNDGKADLFSEFAKVDNPRGIISLGDQVFVLHTTFSKETGIATGMDLVVFEDKNHDDVADGPSKPIIQNICSPTYIVKRGTDHATNGIRMGIDGWIYIAVGDFGFHNATDREGTKLTMLGGGGVRVRPDGTEMEIYTHGLRNIYDVAIDPFMNIYTRGNTNDGGGWNIRFAHHIQTGEYGYPVLFKNFTNEIIPALVDVGGGSGTGALFMDNEQWPEKYNQVPMMADWGRSKLFIHRVTPDGASFKQTEEDFIKLAQITDLDVDASGQLFMSAWDGAGYSGNPDKGFVARAIPKNWKHKVFPDVTKLSITELAELLKEKSAKIRLTAQQELITKSPRKASKAVWKMASDKNLSLETRVAAIFAYAQINHKGTVYNLVQLSNDKTVKEFTLKALTDRKSQLDIVPLELFTEALNDPSERVKAAAIIGLGRLKKVEAANALLQIPVPANAKAPEKGTEGPHATPNSPIIPAHLAVKALVSMNAVNACIKAIKNEESTLALWALKYIHNDKAIDGLIEAYNLSSNTAFKKEILTTLSRLYKQEAPYDGSWWWSTRPDTHGPYYKGITWESSPKIKTFLTNVWKKSNADEKEFFANLNDKHRMGIVAFGGEEEIIVKEEKKIDLEKIKNQKGQIGKTSIEDVMIAISKIKGDPEKGEKLFTNQGCVACHSIKKGEALKGPYMGQIGSIMNRDQIAESILKPNASISQGFATILIEAKNDESYVGFITSETSEKVVMRNIAGIEFTIKTSDIISREDLETSMMPAGLANALSFEEFASLITYLANQKK